MKVIIWGFHMYLGCTIFFVEMNLTRWVLKWRENKNLSLIRILESLQNALRARGWCFRMQLAILFIFYCLLNLNFDYIIVTLPCLLLRCHSYLLSNILYALSFDHELLRCINIISVYYFHILQPALQIDQLILALIVLIYRFQWILGIGLRNYLIVRILRDHYALIEMLVFRGLAGRRRCSLTFAVHFFKRIGSSYAKWTLGC